MIRIKVPCSTSNLGPGFDTLGLALNRYLVLSVEKSDTISVSVEGKGKNHIAENETNLVYAAMKTTAAALRKPLPTVRLKIKNDIPAYGGLGGSGAAIAGGVFLADQLLSGGLSRDAMLNIAVEIEGHPDNVSAALFGGLTINSFDAERNVHCRSVKIEKPLSVVTCSPHFQVKTQQARTLLPQQIPLHDAVANIENAASLVAALMSGDFDALRYTTTDRLHEQYRSTLIPGFHEVKKAALYAGALSFNISGAGPTVFAFTVRNEEAIAEAMTKAFSDHKQETTIETMTIENNGISIVDE